MRVRAVLDSAATVAVGPSGESDSPRANTRQAQITIDMVVVLGPIDAVGRVVDLFQSNGRATFRVTC